MNILLSTDLLIRLLIDFISLIFIVRLTYYRLYKKEDFVFTFFIFNFLIFFIAFFLNQVEISLGAAFGLFAVFSMLRYRTEGLSMKDMTYLFIVIGLGMLNAIVLNINEIISLNIIVIFLTYMLESNIFLKKESTLVFTYDDVSTLTKDSHDVIIEDIRSRTNLKISRIEVLSVDLLRDTAQIKVYINE